MKNWFKSKPYWLKGGIIGVIFGVFFIILAIFRLIDFLIILSVYIVGLFIIQHCITVSYFLRFDNTTYDCFLFSIVFWISIGAILGIVLGLIYGKIRTKARNKY